MGGGRRQHYIIPYSIHIAMYRYRYIYILYYYFVLYIRQTKRRMDKETYP
jgi:hypothetical protein